MIISALSSISTLWSSLASYDTFFCMSQNYKILLYVIGVFFILSFLLLRSRKKKKLKAEIHLQQFSSEEEDFLSKKFHPYIFLTPDEKIKLKDKTIYFLRTKSFFSPDDFPVTPQMKLLIAVQACLLLMNTDEKVYPELSSIFVFEDAYLPKNNPVNPKTGLPMAQAHLGESWHHGPLVVSWKAAATSSVVYHEFAHKLDGEDGTFDGTPTLEFALKQDHVYPDWAQVMGEAFLNLRKRVLAHRSSDINTYGATNEAEFFAILTEYYITKATTLKKNHGDLYEQLDNYFKLSPTRWS